MLSKKLVTKKIIRTKIHTIGKQDIFMNKYKFINELSDKSKSVQTYFDINNKLNSVEEILKNTNDEDIIIFQNNVDILKRNENEVNDQGIFDDVKKVITYPNAFSEEEVKLLQLKTSEIYEEISALEFAKSVVQAKKEQALTSFDLKNAIKYNDKLVKLNEKISNLTDQLKEIAMKILQVEDDFIAKFNQLVLDIKEKNIAKNVSMESLIEEYSAEVVKEYLFRAKIALVMQIFEGASVDEIISHIENSTSIKEHFKDDFANFLEGIKNVGANI